MKIVIASHNSHKIREFRTLFKPLKQFDVLSLHDFPKYKLPLETGDSFKENAEIKAKDAAEKLGHYVVADDSGLVVPKLNNSPGVYSARYAGEEATDRENRRKLLDEMEGFADIDRSAYYECVLVLASPDRIIKSVSGKCEGQIVEEERGGSGFGYDPLFLKYDYDKTFAQLPEATKIVISHRGKAFEKMIPTLEHIKTIYFEANAVCD
ncbi:MAG: RdgB/HAM1 family non-canonical purine NTP pyrophosphatase [Waddliaceae bacterium]